MTSPIDVDASTIVVIEPLKKIPSPARNESIDTPESTKTIESTIAERITTNVFPVVYPTEQNSENEKQEKGTLSLVDKMESVALQSYIDEQWRIYREDLPVDDSIPEAVRRARWSRECYYFHMRRFLEEKRDVIVESLHEWISKDKVSEELTSLTSQLEAEAVKDLLNHINDAWNTCLANLPEFARIDNAAVRHAWFEKKCLDVIRSFEWPLKPAFVFYPELALKEIKNESDKDVAYTLYNRVKETHVPLITRIVNSEFAKELKNIPEYLRGDLVNNLRNQFLHKEYLKIVRHVVDNTLGFDSFVFMPRVALDSIKNPEERAKASLLLKQVRECHVVKIEDLLLSRYRTATTGIDATMLESVGEEMWMNFISKHYYNIVREIVDEVDATSVRKETGVKKSRSSGSNVNAFASPMKKAKTKVSPACSTTKELAIVTVNECHTRDSKASEAVVLKAAVMHYPDDISWVDVTNRRTKQKQKVAVMSILLADASGPITLEVWRELAESVFQLFSKWEEKATNDTLWVEVSNVWIRDEKDRYIPSMRRLCANERTKVTLSFPMVLSLISPPADDLHIDDFLPLMSMSPPFFVNATGVVCTVQEESTSLSGLPMKVFRLQDHGGRFVMCIAFGRHVDNILLEEGNKVTLFFAKALSGLGGNYGSLWMYDTTHIVLWKKECMIPEGSTLVELR